MANLLEFRSLLKMAEMEINVQLQTPVHGVERAHGVLRLWLRLALTCDVGASQVMLERDRLEALIDYPRQTEEK
jgi:hypothetical protein